jgi:hypothetical protein
MQDRHMPSRVLRVIRIVRPSISPWRFRVPDQLEHFNDSLPYRLALKDFFYRDTLDVLRLDSVQFADYVL